MKAFIMAVLLFVPLSVAAHSPIEFLDLIDKTKHSVVHVQNGPTDEALAELELNGPTDEDKEKYGDGTGFIIEGGYIITNHHVIAGGENIKVYFEGNRTPFPVTIIGSDEETDVAVLKPDHTFPKNIKPLQWRSEQIRVGAEIWAIGHPQGLEFSVSKGIVSHLNRRVESPWQRTIQFDAAINSGNSGGPLLDMDGNVVGINVMILSRVAEFNGLALAIDGFTARTAIKTLIAKGEIVRPLMGVMLSYDNDAYRVYAQGVGDDGPAGEAGMEVGDLYVSIDGFHISIMNDVFDVLAERNPGDVIKVKVIRDGKTLTLDIKLGTIQN